jgi:hypothetical protein
MMWTRQNFDQHRTPLYADPHTVEGVDAMGRGRQKAKQTKVARKLKYFSPDTDLEALQRELAAERKGADPDDPYAKYIDDDDQQDDSYEDLYEDRYADMFADEDDEDDDYGAYESDQSSR